jgi:hypothetical protein
MQYILNETGHILMVLSDQDGNAGAAIYYKSFSLYFTHGQHATHFDGEKEAMNTALTPLFGRIGPLKGMLCSVIQFQQYSQ